MRYYLLCHSGLRSRILGRHVTFDTDWWEWADEAGRMLNAYLAQDGDVAALPGGTDDER